MRIVHKVFKGVMMLVLLAILGILLGYIVERLWNWLMPGIFGLPPITYWKAVGLLVLSKILLGGFHPHGGGRGHRGRGWKRRMKQRFAGMSPEEREKFRAGMRGRHGCGPQGWGPGAWNAGPWDPQGWGPEDKQRFKQEMRSRWGRGPRGGFPQGGFPGGGFPADRPPEGSAQPHEAPFNEAHPDEAQPKEAI